MVINVAFKQMNTSDTLSDYMSQKSERLKKYFNGRIHVSWNVSHEKHSKVAHCHLVGNQMDYFGDAECEDFHEAIDSVIDKIERQIKKHKEKVTDHLHTHDRPVPTEGDSQA